jgi:cell division protein FtsW
MMVVAGIAGLMYFLANTPWQYTIGTIAVGFAALFAFIKITPYRMQRFLVFLNPDVDPMGSGYQLKQALIAIGSGGLIGKGLGLSSQKLGYLPEVIADSVFAVFSEETGFIGCFVLIALLICYFWRGLKIASNQETFPKLVVIGIISWILIQSFVNIGSMTGLMPLTGIPLPFISYGGSALAIELAAMGLVLNISRR